MDKNHELYGEYKELLEASLDTFKEADSTWLFGNILGSYYNDRTLLHLSEQETMNKLLDVADPGYVGVLMMDSLQNMSEYIELRKRTAAFCQDQGLNPDEAIGIIKRGEIPDDGSEYIDLAAK